MLRNLFSEWLVLTCFGCINSKNLSACSLNAVTRISPESSKTSNVNSFPWPDAFDQVLISLLLDTRPRIVTRLWYGLRDEIGIVAVPKGVRGVPLVMPGGRFGFVGVFIFDTLFPTSWLMFAFSVKAVVPNQQT